jgi:hypothetical protein
MAQKLKSPVRAPRFGPAAAQCGERVPYHFLGGLNISRYLGGKLDQRLVVHRVKLADGTIGGPSPAHCQHGSRQGRLVEQGIDLVSRARWRIVALTPRRVIREPPHGPA